MEGELLNRARADWAAIRRGEDQMAGTTIDAAVWAAKYGSELMDALTEALSIAAQMRAALEAEEWAQADKGPPVGDSVQSLANSSESIRRTNAELSIKARNMRRALISGVEWEGKK